MGKRSDFPRRAQDASDTPLEAVAPLIPHLPYPLRYWEPCAGSGALVQAIGDLSDGAFTCDEVSDIKPRSLGVVQRDAFQVTDLNPKIDYIITNPPWTREILHPMIEHFAAMRPTWLLFDADWPFTKQSAPFMGYCHKI